jgi:hypothetical protein
MIRMAMLKVVTSNNKCKFLTQKIWIKVTTKNRMKKKRNRRCLDKLRINKTRRELPMRAL